MTATEQKILLNRRRLLMLAAIGSAGILTQTGWNRFFQTKSLHTAEQNAQLFSARHDLSGQHWCESYHLDGSSIFRTPVAQRPHDIVTHHAQAGVLFVARRPGTECYWLDKNTGELLFTLKARAQRHFYGHGVFDSAGQYLYLTENDTRDPGRGVIGVYRQQHNQLIFEAELSSHGIGPHQIIRLPDSNHFVIANGGIRTEAESRKDMNLDAMASSLVIIDQHGQLLSQDSLPEQQSSIRHLAAFDNGTIITSQQFMGELSESSTLIAIKRPNQPLQAFPLTAEQHQLMRQYTASIAVNSEKNLLAVSAPRGNRLMVWHVTNQQNLLDMHLPDCAGIAATDAGFIVSSGQTRCVELRHQQDYLEQITSQLPRGGWDNHLLIT